MTPAATDTAGVSGRRSGATATALTEDYLPVPEDALVRAAGKDAFPAITEPAFAADWSGVDPDLVDADRVIGVERNGIARAYPLNVLHRHEVVNDDLGGPLLVTYCPLCATGIVAERELEGRVLTFGVSGSLFQSNLVMYDVETESLWSQLHALAIRGELTGTRLALFPSTMTTWGQWRTSHTNAEVLLPAPESNTIKGRVQIGYSRDRYVGYDRSERIGVGDHAPVDDRLHPKTMVIGVANDGAVRAYPLSALARVDVVNDDVGGRPVVVAAFDTTLVAYDRTVDGEVLAFSREDDVLRGGGSRWDGLSGRALDGPHEGRTLERANDRSPMFWFAWADAFPETGVYGQ